MYISTIATTSLLLVGSTFAADLRHRQVATSAVASPSGTPSATTPGSGVPVWVVKVGNEAGGLVFEPNNLTANVGDMVQFQFYPKVRVSDLPTMQPMTSH